MHQTRARCKSAWTIYTDEQNPKEIFFMTFALELNGTALHLSSQPLLDGLADNTSARPDRCAMACFCTSR
jgi:hypothetical protein